LETSWGKWLDEFLPFFHKFREWIFSWIQTETGTEERIAEGVSGGLALLRDRMDPALRETFLFSLSTALAGDRIVARLGARIQVALGSHPDVAEKLEKAGAGLFLSSLLLGAWMEREGDRPDSFPDHVDFLVLMIKRSAAVYYMNLLRLSRE